MRQYIVISLIIASSTIPVFAQNQATQVGLAVAPTVAPNQGTPQTPTTNTPTTPESTPPNTNDTPATTADSTEPVADNAVTEGTEPAADSLLTALSPNDSELSRANTELLAQNAELTRRVDDLTTQVNVLVQERSGQLYIYGASTAIFCVILGFIFAKLTTRKRW